jgi:hypothetical protein
MRTSLSLGELTDHELEAFGEVADAGAKCTPDFWLPLQAAQIEEVRQRELARGGRARQSIGFEIPFVDPWTAYRTTHAITAVCQHSKAKGPEYDRLVILLLRVGLALTSMMKAAKDVSVN